MSWGLPALSVLAVPDRAHLAAALSAVLEELQCPLPCVVIFQCLFSSGARSWENPPFLGCFLLGPEGAGFSALLNPLDF